MVKMNYIIWDYGLEMKISFLFSNGISSHVLAVVVSDWLTDSVAQSLTMSSGI
jgi:hypothetical protein